MANKTITIKLRKSPISCTTKQKATITGLGLKKVGSEKTLENTPCVRGMIKKMINWVEVVSEQ
jgi:large subunit ribosomal protein L30